jgi:hypothetical protein
VIVAAVCGRRRRHVLRRLARGDVLEHHLQRREVAPQRLHHAVDEHRLAVEQVDLGVGHLAVHQQQQAARCMASSVA